MRYVFTALMIGGIVASGQTMVADARAAREGAANAAQFTHGIQLENLRFVRDGSSPDPARSRPFSTLNLANQDLVGLQLANADFAYTDLSDSRLIARHQRWGLLSGQPPPNRLPPRQSARSLLRRQQRHRPSQPARGRPHGRRLHGCRPHQCRSQSRQSDRRQPGHSHGDERLLRRGDQVAQQLPISAEPPHPLIYGVFADLHHA